MPLLEILGELSAWAYLLVFAAALAEALPAIGTLVPGQTFVVAAGAAASAGYLDPWGVLAAATLGAAAGDAGAYWIGHTQGRRFLDRHGARFGLTPPRLERTAALLQRNPFLAIVGGRFSAVTRALVPFVAGSLSFRIGLFMAYNAVGAVLWAGASVALGLAVGTGYHAAERIVGGVMLALVLCAAGLWLAYRVVRWVSPAIRRADAIAFLAAAAGVALFWVAAENVAGGDQMARVDPKAQAFLEARYTPALGSLMQGATFLASGYVLGPAALLAIALLWRTRRADVFRIAAAVLLEQGALRIAREAMARPHPDLPHAAAVGYSFPSGPAAAAT
ncbi:MAG TPA: VTT domain-containing protein, partial [Candidatus Thermoplasmatota archaeon]|nr:VTT domain-containing protein [Candidatus Thermoplasmatota archaeon]